MAIGLRFSVPLTILFGGLLTLAEATLTAYPYLIPIDPIRFVVQGAIPLFTGFLYQTQGLEKVPDTPLPAPSIPVPTPPANA